MVIVELGGSFGISRILGGRMVIIELGAVLAFCKSEGHIWNFAKLTKAQNASGGIRDRDRGFASHDLNHLTQLHLLHTLGSLKKSNAHPFGLLVSILRTYSHGCMVAFWIFACWLESSIIQSSAWESLVDNLKCSLTSLHQLNPTCWVVCMRRLISSFDPLKQNGQCMGPLSNESSLDLYYHFPRTSGTTSVLLEHMGLSENRGPSFKH
ncbi:hypothetical protein VNO77_03241 [Canavalia gladiata]|uniref:Uncharacterized protein n=1 Tax=Canavalia gladiata TaxID=3824 RepID=A0AAN9N010_CANGL